MNFAHRIITGMLIAWCLWFTLYGGCHCYADRPFLKLAKLLLWLLGSLAL